MPTLSALEKGYAFLPVQFIISSEWVDRYIEAVEDESARAAPDAVPPTALATLAIRSLLEQSDLPPGSIHVGQEISLQRAVSPGESLEVKAEVLSKGERQGWVLMAVGLTVGSGASETAMEGRATITFPVEAADGP